MKRTLKNKNSLVEQSVHLQKYDHQFLKANEGYLDLNNQRFVSKDILRSCEDQGRNETQSPTLIQECSILDTITF